MRFVAKARVQVTMEIALSSTYGPEWTVDAIQKDAADHVLKLVKGGGRYVGPELQQRAEIINAPRVSILIVSPEEP